ncbi:MAG: hypothetical protein JPMHGGIA_00954 [Saprospiraceae bacterium]|nr:hypothetical protein [Saprospiraceae bacterium]
MNGQTVNALLVVRTHFKAYPVSGLNLKSNHGSISIRSVARCQNGVDVNAMHLVLHRKPGPVSCKPISVGHNGTPVKIDLAGARHVKTYLKAV